MAREFDFNTMFTDLRKADVPYAVLRGHLYLESIASSMMDVIIVEKSAIDVEELRFENKVKLLCGLGYLERRLLPPLLKVNGWRNKIAHRLDFALTEDHARELGCLLIGEEREVAKLFGYIREDGSIAIPDAIATLGLAMKGMEVVMKHNLLPIKQNPFDD